jgi:tRNA (guanine37-N1)-methyltransferase
VDDAGTAAADAASPWQARVLTLFPEMFPGPLGHSLAGKALEAGLWRFDTLDIRAFARDKHRSVDDTPFGGGAGMVMRPDVVGAAIMAARADAGGAPLLYLSPRGRPFTQDRARALAAGPGAVLLCGRYEGVDQRVLDHCAVEEVSVGDYVLSGGELAALVVLDAVVRLLPGVMGNSDTLSEESFEQGLLEYPLYTRPAVWEGMAVPDVLLSGHHDNIRRWRLTQAQAITRARRPDLWAKVEARFTGDIDKKRKRTRGAGAMGSAHTEGIET